MRMRRFASLFGEMLLYQHQRIVTMTKVYIASNNLPVEIIRFHTIGFSDLLSRIRNSTTTGTCLSRTVHFGKYEFRPLNCIISCYYVQAVRPESRYKRQFGSNSLLFTAFKTVYLDSRVSEGTNA